MASRTGTASLGTPSAGGLGGSFGQPNSFVVAPAPTPEPAPAAPDVVLPFPTADDMIAVNNWLTDWTTQMEDIDFGISQQEVDTKYQKGANDRQAVEDRTAADEAMAARGIFTSSLRDAAAMDIEATRALANTYLDNKLQEAITAGTTRKGTLATAKGNFETGMAAKYGENAKGVNDALNEGYATALANYKPPKATTPSAAGPTAAKKTPAATPKQSSASLAFKTTQQVTNKASSQATGASRAKLNSSTPAPKKPKAPKAPKPKGPRRGR